MGTVALWGREGCVDGWGSFGLFLKKKGWIEDDRRRREVEQGEDQESASS